MPSGLRLPSNCALAEKIMVMEQGALCRHVGLSKAGPWEQEGAFGSLQAELAANGVDQGRGSNEFHYFCHLLEKLTMWQQLAKAIRGSGANSVLALAPVDAISESH